MVCIGETDTNFKFSNKMLRLGTCEIQHPPACLTFGQLTRSDARAENGGETGMINNGKLVEARVFYD